MSNYTLSNSAAVIDSAITRVASADTTPTANSESMVTSGGVKTYVDNVITPTQTSAIGLTDSDSFVPTSAAVKDYVEGELFSASPGHSRLFLEPNVTAGYSRSSSGYVPFKNDPFSIGQIVSLNSSGATMSFPQGTYLVELVTSIGSRTGTWRYQLRHNGSVKMQSASNADLDCKIFVSSNSVQTVQLYTQEISSGTLITSSAAIYVTRLYSN